MTTQALVFANGDMNDGPRVRQALDAAPDALVVAADGGARIAEAYGRRIDLIVGDMDSVDEAILARLVASGTEVERHSEYKDETDLELALTCAVERGASWIRIIGGLGGRLDQSLSNVYLLALPILTGCDVALVAERYEARLLLPGTTMLAGAEGDTVSLIPISGVAAGITTDNLYYPLRDEALMFGPARGVSNVMTGATASVTFAEGVLLLIHTQGAGLMTPVTVQKRNHLGEKVWQYSGDIVERGDNYVCLVARFGRDDVDTGYVVFRRGDLMTEWFYSDRWYNVFRLEDVDDGRLKGWYCNIGRPALLGADVVAYDDLALDVFVAPDGTVRVLDEDEFAALALPDADVAAAWAAVDTIRELAAIDVFPFVA